MKTFVKRLMTIFLAAGIAFGAMSYVSNDAFAQPNMSYTNVLPNMVPSKVFPDQVVMVRTYVGVNNRWDINKLWDKVVANNPNMEAYTVAHIFFPSIKKMLEKGYGKTAIFNAMNDCLNFTKANIKKQRGEYIYFFMANDKDNKIIDLAGYIFTPKNIVVWRDMSRGGAFTKVEGLDFNAAGWNWLKTR